MTLDGWPFEREVSGVAGTQQYDATTAYGREDVEASAFVFRQCNVTGEVERAFHGSFKPVRTPTLLP